MGEIDTGGAGMMASKEKIKDYCSLDFDYFKRLSDPYDYLINTYIPSQGGSDMAAFLSTSQMQM